MAIIKYEDIVNKDGFNIGVFIFGTLSATGANFDSTYPIVMPCELEKIRIRYSAASISGTLQFQRLTNGTAPGSGTNLLTTAFDLTATANTVYSRDEADFVASVGRQFFPGDALGMNDSGVLTNLSNLCISFYFRPIGKGHYK